MEVLLHAVVCLARLFDDIYIQYNSKQIHYVQRNNSFKLFILIYTIILFESMIHTLYHNVHFIPFINTIYLQQAYEGIKVYYLGRGVGTLTCNGGGKQKILRLVKRQHVD